MLVSPPAAGPATLWDGAWYLEIARSGYHAAPFEGGFHDFAFWPAWPALLGGMLRLVPLSPDVVAGLVASGLSIAALVLWARVLERAFGRSTSRYAIALAAFSPAAFVLSMGYSEPLFLLVGALFFLAAEAGPTRPLLALLAQATRLTGFALGAAMLPRLFRSSGRDRWAWLTLAAPAVVFVAWWIVVAVLTGNPAGYLEGSPSWLPVSSGGPLSYFVLGGGWLLPVGISAATLAIIVAGTLVLLRQGRWELASYALALVLPALALGSWQAMPRYLLVAVPSAAGIMAVLPRFHRRLLLVSSVIAESFYAFFVLGAHFAP